VIRVIVRTDDAAMAANVGGHVLTTYKTFDVDLDVAELEKFLRLSLPEYSHRQICGWELLP